MLRTFKRPLAAAFVVTILLATLWALPAVSAVQEQGAADSPGALSAAEFSYAETYADFDTTEFNVEAVCDKNHVIHMKETIKVDFNQSPHHGIERYIPEQPKYYTIGNIEVGDWDVAASSETQYAQDGTRTNYRILRIGNASEYLSGPQEFVITYDMVCYKDRSSDEDYLSLDLLPTEWLTAIQSSTITLTMPKKVDWNKVDFYSGSYGAEGGLSEAFTLKQVSNKEIRITGKNISDYSGVTVRATLPEGYYDDPADRTKNRWVLYLMLVLVPIVSALLWFFLGRDPQLVKTVEFYPPEDMTPAELGYIFDGKVDDEDIASMVVYYAHKGYLKINEEDRSAFKLKKVKDIDEGEKDFSKYMFNAIFQSGDEVDLSDMPDSFGDELLVVRDKLLSYYSSKKRTLFTGSSVAARAFGGILMLVPGVASVIMAGREVGDGLPLFWLIATLLLQFIGMNMVLAAYDKKDARSRGKNFVIFLFGIAVLAAGATVAAVYTSLQTGSIILGILVMISEIITFIFVMLMKKRTTESNEWLGKILGFRDFVRDVEYDKLKELVDQDPQYFYHVMPYAYVMGMSGKWARKFKNIDMQRADWYEGYSDATLFNSLWYLNMMNYANRNMVSSMEHSRVSEFSEDFGGGIGGGFGGGGFSGGGFGGGGGGAW